MLTKCTPHPGRDPGQRLAAPVGPVRVRHPVFIGGLLAAQPDVLVP